MSEPNGGFLDCERSFAWAVEAPKDERTGLIYLMAWDISGRQCNGYQPFLMRFFPSSSFSSIDLSGLHSYISSHVLA